MRVADCLTPPGRSAIATIRVTGFESVHEFDPFFRSATGRPISKFPIGRVVFGNWTNLQDRSEELVVVRVSESEIQIHCHGGALPIQAILETLERIGFHSTSTSRKSSYDATHLEEELLFGLLNAPTKKIANILFNLTSGGIQGKVDEWITEIDEQETGSDDMIRQMSEFMNTFVTGRFLVRPIHVVLAGMPNVGKSSLNNQILGYARSIILDQPGTTRDVVSERTTIDGWSFEFSDTAGLRNTAEEIEAEGISVAKRRIQNADIIVLVYTAEFGVENIPEQIRDLEEQWIGYDGPVISVLNKIDLVDPEDANEFNLANQNEFVLTNASTGEGIEGLMQRIKETAIVQEPNSEDVLLFTSRQLEILQEAIFALQSDNRKGAVEKLLTF